MCLARATANSRRLSQQNPYKTCVSLVELGRTSRHFIVHFEKIPTKKFPRYRRCAYHKSLGAPIPLPVHASDIEENQARIYVIRLFGYSYQCTNDLTFPSIVLASTNYRKLSAGKIRRDESQPTHQSTNPWTWTSVVHQIADIYDRRTSQLHRQLALLTEREEDYPPHSCLLPPQNTVTPLTMSLGKLALTARCTAKKTSTFPERAA